jgi:hypothetical protein
MTEAIDEALHRTLERADRAGCTPEGHAALVEGVRQIGDRMTGMDGKLDLLLARSAGGSLVTLGKWAAAIGTAAAGFWAGYKGTGQ